ncbi:unnamed protein product [Mytilus coruscus]|uniref:Uncharacterized protein n=1 Tax=Mytilus coruscus TaxID=42192 RepID=A0A6J8A201_MYTCO|nr:unnamed protein product [Mytilus coruscus]
MLQHYFNNFVMRFTVADYTTAWQRLEVGIVTGCTISVDLFSAAINLLVKPAEKTNRGPVKCLDKWFRDSLNDRESVDDHEMVSQAGKWMDIINQSGLPGKYKAWSYQQRILPRILLVPRITWPMLMYEVPLAKVASLEMMFNKHLRKWLGGSKEIFAALVCTAPVQNFIYHCLLLQRSLKSPKPKTL